MSNLEDSRKLMVDKVKVVLTSAQIELYSDTLKYWGSNYLMTVRERVDFFTNEIPLTINGKLYPIGTDMSSHILEIDKE